MMIPPMRRNPPRLTATATAGQWLTGLTGMRTGVITRIAAMVIMRAVVVPIGIGPVLLDPLLTHRNRLPPPAEGTRVLLSCILVAGGILAIRVGGREAVRVRRG
jgi:hypothetical protein